MRASGLLLLDNSYNIVGALVRSLLYFLKKLWKTMNMPEIFCIQRFLETRFNSFLNTGMTRNSVLLVKYVGIRECDL